MWPADLNEALSWSRATPWKAATEVRRLLAWPWIRFYLALKQIRVGTDWRLYGTPVIQRHRDSRISIGDRLELRSWAWSNPLVADHRCLLATWTQGASIEIGDGFAMTGGSICAAQHIEIGDDVTIGANCVIMDTDFHQLPGNHDTRPREAATQPVMIKDSVFIGTRSLVLKGVSIGPSAVIGAGSVVTRSIPANTVAVGNPARVISEAR